MTYTYTALCEYVSKFSTEQLETTWNALLYMRHTLPETIPQVLDGHMVSVLIEDWILAIYTHLSDRRRSH